jgi:LysR family glycine cleavage system transcriptional activator
VDAGLRYGPGHWPGLEAVHLFDDWLTPIASPRADRTPGPADAGNARRLPVARRTGRRWSDWFTRFGGKAPKRYVANFDDSETLHRAAVEGMGIVLGRLTLAWPLIDSNRLCLLFDEKLKADFAHYLVTPPRSRGHAGLAAFRAWLLDEARTYTEAQS